MKPEIRSPVYLPYAYIFPARSRYPVPEEEPDRPQRLRVILVLLSLAQLMIVLDFSIVNVALPSIQAQFQLAPIELQWVVSAYALTFGGFLLLGGRASDLFRRKSVFIVGLIVFSLASLLGGFAISAEMIFISRAIQGLGAAMLSPTALSLVTTTFREGHERNAALGIFGSMAAIGFTVGVILGGILTSALSWHWVFFVNVPIGAFAIIAGIFVLPGPVAKQQKRGFDVTGAVLITTSLLLVIYAITEASYPGESPYYLGILLALSIALVVSFVYVERRAALPLVPFDIFRRRLIAISDMIMFLTFAANAALVFVMTLFLQEVRGFSPLETGLIFIPAGLGGLSGATLAPRVIRRIGYRLMIIIGLSLFAAGMLALATLGTTSSIILLMAYYYATALGLVSTVVSLNIAGTTGVVHERQGLAAGLLTTAQQIGAAIGVSVASVVLTGIARSTGSTKVITVQGYHASLYAAELFLVPAVILAILLIKRGLARKDLGIPATGGG
jgi:EmrB/QacA subfamily drug resistance transporter